ncbi:MAG: ParB/RepB/Spo0J family partition protein [Acidobacteria bacterium]|nr:ParB/RepB/Spo0J family partition protein [Acidobacteriota bacterium]
MARQPLGRGLSALLGDDTAATAEALAPVGATTSEIDIDLISPNPQQPRTRFTEENLEELAQSIRSNGVVQPIVLRQIEGKYQIVAGERRWRASQKAGLRKIPAVIREVSDEKMLELALIENIQRQELNPIEEAIAYRKLIENIGLTQEQLSERVGRERSLIATSVRLLRLPTEIQRAIEEGELSAGHGRALLMSDDGAVQREIANAAIDGGWSVRETERAVKSRRRYNSGKKSIIQKMEDPNAKAAAVKMMRALNTNVKVIPGKKGTGGKIEIEYYSLDDFARIFEILTSKQ